MKKITKFIDEISGEEFNSKTKAKTSERKNIVIKNAFNFYIKDKKKPKDGNDDIGVKRTEEFYYKLIDTLIAMVKKYEPRILENYEKVGGLTRDYTKGWSMLSRFLDEGNSNLYKWWGIQGNICPKCFREYGQMYFALNCKCKK